MSTITKEWLQQKIADMEAIRDDIPFGLGEDGTNTLAALRMALVSLEAEHAGFIVKQKVTGKFGSWLHSKADWFRSDEYEVLSAYTAPPAPVSVPEGALKMLLPDVEKSEFWFEHDGKILFEGVKFNNAVFEACRAAMLQGAVGNSPVIPDGWVILPADPTQAMMNAWLSEVANWRGHASGYRAMIAAAPKPEA